MKTYDIAHKRKCVVLDDVSEMYELGHRHFRRCESYARGWHYDTRDFLDATRTGRADLVEVSDQMMSTIEDQIPLTRGWRVREDVVGAVPNVPAMIAGLPQHMRRRDRVSKDTAPVTVFVDISASAAVSDTVMVRRGAALLAFSRMLAQVRPVELWAGVMWSDATAACSVVWRIDTMPMDLARAAVHLADPRTSRILGFGVGSDTVDQTLYGTWHDMPRRFQELRTLQGWPEDTLYVPHIHLHDLLSTNPVAFVRRELSKYTGQQED